MKIRTFTYTLKQGIRNIFRNKWFTVASLATISACLFVFGIFFCFAINANHTIRNMEEGVSVFVYFEPGTSEERIFEIGELIGSRAEVANYVYVSADEAWADFAPKIGETVECFTENPLADSANYQIYLKDVALQDQLVSYLKTIPDVRKVNSSDIANVLAALNVAMTYVFGGMIILLLCVSVFLISNTVTIGISVRKEEITIMKYIGATDYFVRAPFVYECLILGFIGAVIPMVLNYYLYIFAMRILDKYSYIISFISLLDPKEVFIYLVPASLIIGIGIGFFGSFFTVRKHLKV